MTNTARSLLAGLVLAAATALAIVGMLTDDANRSNYVGGAASMYTLVLGYVFGNRNGEQALAKAIVQTEAAHGVTAATQLARDTVDPHTPTPAEVSSPPVPPS